MYKLSEFVTYESIFIINLIQEHNLIMALPLAQSASNTPPTYTYS